MDSYTGPPNGGFKIEPEKLHHITVADIVKAIDGDAFFKDCALGLVNVMGNILAPPFIIQ